MTSKLRQEASRLANRSYRFEVAADETTDGRPMFVASVLELEGCVGGGTTARDALEDVRAAMVDYIESLLEDGIAVPVPLDDLPVSVSSGYPLRRLTSKVSELTGQKAPEIVETEKPTYLVTGRG